LSSITGYLLDTNVVSETRRARPNERVMSFIDSVEDEGLYLSVLTVAELRRRVEIMRRSNPDGALRLRAWVDDTESDYAERILPVDLTVARLWDVLSADRGRLIVDTMIAATALVHDLTLVTRNTAHVQGLGLSLVNPWDESA
jgi:predicted nucleic acid-binding protein